MTDLEYRYAALWIGFGVVALLAELIVPAFMRALPGTDWGDGEVPAGRYSRIVGCLACVVIGLVYAGVFPASLRTPLFVLVGAALLRGLALDALARSNREAEQARRDAARSAPLPRSASVRTPVADRPPRGRQKRRRSKR